jgi:hypothetical protein
MIHRLVSSRCQPHSCATPSPFPNSMHRPKPSLSPTFFRSASSFFCAPASIWAHPSLWIGSRPLDHLACPIPDLQAATFVVLTFTCQKNGVVRNETTGHGRSGDPAICPVICVISRLISLRAMHATPTTPLKAYSVAPPRYVHSADVTRRVRAALARCTPIRGTPHQMSPPALPARAEPWPFYVPLSTATVSE